MDFVCISYIKRKTKNFISNKFVETTKLFCRQEKFQLFLIRGKDKNYPKKHVYYFCHEKVKKLLAL